MVINGATANWKNWKAKSGEVPALVCLRRVNLVLKIREMPTAEPCLLRVRTACLSTFQQMFCIVLHGLKCFCNL